ncbi:MAG TPA: hypothetical protein VGR00_14005, partial [Thermoanaerobaculia bacterium]|nr:hypothetical protein [Thermoanaerobaculia bacterium]
QNAYAKTAMLLASCERELGEETWARVMKTYATRWAFRHPTTADFRAVVKEIAGESADALFRETWDSTGSIDYAVSVATSKRVEPAVGYAGDGSAFKFTAAAKEPPKSGPFESVVVVKRLGDAVWPVDVELRFHGGQKVRRRWDGKERWIRYRITGPELEEAVVDPDRKVLLDVDLLNNGRRVEKAPAPAERWGHRLRFFAQNVLSLFALLGAAI